MNKLRSIASTVSVVIALGFGVANADYETHPRLKPEHRCGGVPFPGDDGVDPPAIPPEWATNEGYLVYGPDGGPYETARGEAALNSDGSPVTAADIATQTDPGGVDSLHCQKLFWDTPSPTAIGAIAIAAPYAEDTIPRWPNGVTDRPPGLYTDGTDGFELPAPGREALCPENMIPWWAPVFDNDGDGQPDPDRREPIKRDFTELQDVADAIGGYVFLPAGLDGGDGILNNPDSPADPQYGEVFQLSCRRGVRSYYGPWQTGTHFNEYDKVFPGTATRFETTPLLDADAAAGRLCEGENEDDVCICDAARNGLGADLAADPVRLPLDGELCAGKSDGETVDATGRKDWNTGSDYYNHFASHHGTCWNPETGLTSGAFEPDYKCNNPDDPWAASDYEEGGTCHSYHQNAEPADDSPNCNADPDCKGSLGGQMFRNATQYPGRLYVEIPDGRGVISLEKQTWRCDHHVVTQLPPGSYSMTKLANYRLQKGGVRNPRVEGVNCGMEEDDPETRWNETRTCNLSVGGHLAGSGEYIGGSVGEMLIQYFTDPISDPSVKPINVQFEIVQDLATTWYPPFTFNVHKVTWWAPFDLAIGLITTHSHHRNSIGYMDIHPANPVRLDSDDPTCGGAAGSEVPPEHVYLNTNWEDANLCEYWKHPDGPLIMRKGQTIQTTCYVNNGVTPEAIKHGLIGGSVVESFRAYNVEQSGESSIPEQPGSVPTSTWADTFAQSPVGTEFLYGTHPPINYRVAYKCGAFPGVSSPTAEVCNPNPAIDPDGDYIDGAYLNEDQCGGGGWCNPATIMFANVGEDEMCIPVFMFWRLDNIVNQDGSINEEAMENLMAGNIDEVGTPGAIPKWAGDIGDCRECQPGW